MVLFEDRPVVVSQSQFRLTVDFKDVCAAGVAYIVAESRHNQSEPFNACN